MSKNTKERLLKKLQQLSKKKIEKLQVVMLPDFFIDHFLKFKNFDSEIKKINKIYKQGGGNIPSIKQNIIQGGNATNTALALAKLGVKSHLICRTNKLGLNLLKFFLGKENVDLTGVKTDGKLSKTTVMEFGKKHTNIMLNDTGSISDFSYNKLEEKDLDIIAKSDLVGVVNWSLNKKGVDLAEKVFSLAKKHNVKTFLDTGDPSHRKAEIPELKKKVLYNKNLDILSLNENELKKYAGYEDKNKKEMLIKMGKTLKENISARLDVHTKDFSYSLQKNQNTIVPAFKLSSIHRSTGAGDSWSAGDILGELLNLQGDERLLLSNAAAGFYISSTQPKHPNIEEIIRFLKEKQVKKIGENGVF